MPTKTKFNITKMGILCWMSEYIGQYRIRNENKCIKEKVMIALIMKKMVESCLR